MHRAMHTLAKRLMDTLFLFLAIFLAMADSIFIGNNESAVPAVYLFGDSTFDVGTNNFLNDSKSRADQPFYGIDFPNKMATGRFSNGYNTADSIVKLLGLNQSPQPYLYLVNDTENFMKEILKGVNFASGGSGILENTGRRPYINVVSMGTQIEQFTTIGCNISQYLNNTAEATIHKSLFLISVGSNDILEFFFYNVSQNPFNATAMVLDFIPNLISNYQTHLQNLLDLGARKFGILSVPPIGCVPVLSALANATTHCVDEINDAALLFYTYLVAMLRNLNSQYPDMKYSLGNSYNITYNMIDNSGPLNLNNVTSACCGNQTFEVSGLSLSTVGVPCSPNASVCENRNNFLFWDQYHPTEYASKIAANALYNGSLDYVLPMNFSLLVQDS